MASRRGGGGYYRGDQGGNWGYPGRSSTRGADVQDSFEVMPRDDKGDGTYSTAAALLSTVLKMMTSDGPQPTSSESGYPKDWSSSQEYSYRRSNDSSQLDSGYSAGYSEPYGQLSREPPDYSYRPRSPQRTGPYGHSSSSSSSWQHHDSWQDRGQGYSKGHGFSQGAGWQPSGRGKRGRWMGSYRGRGGMPNAQWKPSGQGYVNQTARPGQGHWDSPSQRLASQNQVGKFSLRSQPDKQTPESVAKVQGVAAGGGGQVKESQASQQSLPAKAITTKAVGTGLSKNQKRKLKRLPNKINANQPAAPAQKLPSSGTQPGDGATGAEKGHFGERPVGSADLDMSGGTFKEPSVMASQPSTGDATVVAIKQEPAGQMKRKLTHGEQPLAKKNRFEDHSPEGESSSVFGGLWSTKAKAPKRKGTKKAQYGCSLCQIRTNKPFFIKGHLESVYHQQSLAFLEEEFDRDVAKFLHKLIWRKADFALKRLNEVRCVLSDSDEIFKRGSKRPEREAITLDEALEMRIAVQCHACNTFVPYTSSTVAHHMESAEHQHYKSLYVNERKTVVVAVAKSVLGNDNNSVLLKLFKEGKDPFSNPEYDALFVCSGQGQKQNPANVAGEETSNELAAENNADAGIGAEEVAAQQSPEQTPVEEGKMPTIATTEEDADNNLREDERTTAAAGLPYSSEGAIANGGSVEDTTTVLSGPVGAEIEDSALGEEDVIFTGYVDEGAMAGYGSAQTATSTPQETSHGSTAQGDIQEVNYEEGQQPASSVEAAALSSESTPFFDDTVTCEWGLGDVDTVMPGDMDTVVPVAVGKASSGVSKSPYATRKGGRGRGGASKPKAQ